MTHHTEPVFVDRSGRRRRLVVRAGTVGGALLALTAVVLLAGFTGTGPDAPALPGGTASPRSTVDSGLRTGEGAAPGPAATGAAPTVRATPGPSRSAPGTPVTPAASASRPGHGPGHTPSHPAKDH